MWHISIYQSTLVLEILLVCASMNSVVDQSNTIITITRSFLVRCFLGEEKTITLNPDKCIHLKELLGAAVKSIRNHNSCIVIYDEKTCFKSWTQGAQKTIFDKQSGLSDVPNSIPKFSIRLRRTLRNVRVLIYNSEYFVRHFSFFYYPKEKVGVVI